MKQSLPLAPPVPPMLDESIIRQCHGSSSRADLIERWIAQARACSMQVHRVADNPTSVSAAIDRCLAAHPVRKSILNAGTLEQQYALAAHLAARNIQTVYWGSPDCREAAFHCEASITDCRAGLADTGGILVWSDPTFGRSSTLVIPIHIVLLPVSRIVPDLVDGLRLAYSQPNLPSNIVIINGPSKTADIEMNLITGVHGPKFLHVILIE